MNKMMLKQLFLALLIIAVSACATVQTSIPEKESDTVPEIVIKPDIDSDTIIENINDNVIVTDPDSRITAVEIDEPDIYQYDEEDIIVITDEMKNEIIEQERLAAIEERLNRPGVIINFDDYHPVTWARHFDLFDKYDAKATFFVHEQEVVAQRQRDIFTFCLAAQERGHEVGYHTINHPELTTLTRDQFFEQTVSRLDLFRDAGVELTSFAYPYGTYRLWMNEELLKYYKIVRGISGYKLYTREDMRSGFLDSISIDNIRYRTDTSFRNDIDKMLNLAKDAGRVIILTSHGITDRDYGITPDRLEYVLAKSKELGLTFFRFKDFQ